MGIISVAEQNNVDISGVSVNSKETDSIQQITTDCIHPFNDNNNTQTFPVQLDLSCAVGETSNFLCLTFKKPTICSNFKKPTIRSNCKRNCSCYFAFSLYMHLPLRQ